MTVLLERLERSSLCIIFLLFIAPLKAAYAVEDVPFAVSAELVEALEDGPVIVKLTLTCGDRVDGFEVEYSFKQWGTAYAKILSEKEWTRDEEERAFGGSFRVARHKFKRGETWETFIRLHDGYTRIPSGKTSLEVFFPVSPILKDERGLTRKLSRDEMLNEKRKVGLSTKVDIDVAAATEERLKEFVAKCASRLAKRPPDYKEEEAVVNMLIDAYHPEFAPLAFQLMQGRGPGRNWPELRYYVFRLSLKSKDVRSQLVEYLRDHGVRLDGAIFGFWHTKDVRLDEDEVRTLLNSEDPWIKTFTCQTFPKLCKSASYKEQLLREVEDLREAAERIPAEAEIER